MSKVLRPHTPAPYVLNDSFRTLALCRETLSTGVPSEILTSVSPLKYQLKRLSPPSPKPFSGLSLGPATKPSNDIVMLKTTFPMGCSFTLNFPEPHPGVRNLPAYHVPSQLGPCYLDRKQ